jgi:carboxyl-terminal processing protease
MSIRSTMSTLMRAAIRGLLIDLDPHSAYLDRDASQALNEQASGAYDGLGLEVHAAARSQPAVIAPIDDTPAARAGISPGDIITAIDGKTIDAPTTPTPGRFDAWRTGTQDHA